MLCYVLHFLFWRLVLAVFLKHWLLLMFPCLLRLIYSLHLHITMCTRVLVLTWVTCWHAWTAKYHLLTDGPPWKEQAEETEKWDIGTANEENRGYSLQRLYLETQIHRSLFPGMRCPKVRRISVLVTENLSKWYLNMIHNNWLWENLTFIVC